MTDLRLFASSRPHGLGVECVERGTTSILSCCTMRQRRTCFAGLRSTWARALTGDNDTAVAIPRRPDNSQNPAMVALQRDEATSIERNARQAAFPRLGLPAARRIR